MSGALSSLLPFFPIHISFHRLFSHSWASGNSSHVVCASFKCVLICRVRQSQIPCDTNIPSSIAALVDILSTAKLTKKPSLPGDIQYSSKDVEGILGHYNHHKLPLGAQGILVIETHTESHRRKHRAKPINGQKHKIDAYYSPSSLRNLKRYWYVTTENQNSSQDTHEGHRP